jgi:hypothetical protein
MSQVKIPYSTFSSTNETDLQDIAKRLLKVVLNTIIPTLTIIQIHIY